MNQKVKGIARITSIEDAQALWSAIDGVGATTEAFVRSMYDGSEHAPAAPPSPLDSAQEMALQNLARCVHHAKACFAKATGWYPVSVYIDKLQDGVTAGHLTQRALDSILRGAAHFDVMVEAFTFRHPELQQQAVEQTYQELLASEPYLRTIGGWAEEIMHRACADAIARLYGSKGITEVLKAQSLRPNSFHHRREGFSDVASKASAGPDSDGNSFGDRH